MDSTALVTVSTNWTVGEEATANNDQQRSHDAAARGGRIDYRKLQQDSQDDDSNYHSGDCGRKHEQQ